MEHDLIVLKLDEFGHVAIMPQEIQPAVGQTSVGLPPSTPLVVHRGIGESSFAPFEFPASPLPDLFLP